MQWTLESSLATGVTCRLCDESFWWLTLDSYSLAVFVVWGLYRHDSIGSLTDMRNSYSLSWDIYVKKRGCLEILFASQSSLDFQSIANIIGFDWHLTSSRNWGYTALDVVLVKKIKIRDSSWLVAVSWECLPCDFQVSTVKGVVLLMGMVHSCMHSRLKRKRNEHLLR